MNRRIAAMGKQKPDNRIDPTQFVFACMICPWQVQASNAARRDFGLDGLLTEIGLAHLDHNQEAHATGSDLEVEWADGSTHQAAGEREGALMAMPLPRWWVNT